jgi:hypothetical protein
MSVLIVYQAFCMNCRQLHCMFQWRQVAGGITVLTNAATVLSTNN